jgi:exopolyphosphatase/guanosine-5'-triphosphate,3'-diphosphate pyrophosphatase
MTTNDRARAAPGARGGRTAAPKLYGAVDLGTNNCRLLIAARAGAGLRIVDSYSQIVRLGEGLAASGRLSEPAMTRAHGALAQCVARLRRHKVKEYRCIATQACRAAGNGAAFLAEVRRQLGVRLETIPPKEEAKFALLASLDLIDPAFDFALVIDIGGGSTELCVVDARAAVERGVPGCARRPPILGWASFPIGVVTLAEGYGEGGARPYDELVAWVRAAMAGHDLALRFGPMFAAGRGHLIGNSGTVTALAGVHLRLPRYQRSAVDGLWMTPAEASAARARLSAATLAERAAEPCIGPERADLVVPGCAILDAVWSIWPSARLRVGDRGLREGILLSMMHGRPVPAARRRRRPAAQAGAEG